LLVEDEDASTGYDSSVVGTALDGCSSDGVDDVTGVPGAVHAASAKIATAAIAASLDARLPLRFVVM
jgi:hypothetical protein